MPILRKKFLPPERFVEIAEVLEQDILPTLKTMKEEFDSDLPVGDKDQGRMRTLVKFVREMAERLRKRAGA